MSLCPFTLGANYNCEAPLQPGLLNYILLINKSDISNVAISSGVATSITLKPGKVGYKFEGLRGSFDARYEQSNRGNFAVGFNHIIEMTIFDISSDQKMNIQKMALNEMVAITFLINSPGNANTFFEIYGLGVGLESSQITRISRDTEYMGAFRVTLQTSETLIESAMPLTYFNTDYDTSLSDLNDLLSVGPNTTFPYILPFILA
jgi:hypothetical protein